MLDTFPPKFNETRLEFSKGTFTRKLKRNQTMQENRDRVTDGLWEFEFITGLWPQLDQLGKAFQT